MGTGTGKGKARDPEVEAYWREQVRRWEQSGSTVKQFCREEGLAAHSVYFWKREISKRDAEELGKPSLIAAEGRGEEDLLEAEAEGSGSVAVGACACALPSPAAAAVGPRFAELLLAGTSSGLEVDEVEVQFRGGTAVRFRGGCPLAMIECVLAALGWGQAASSASAASERRSC